MTSTESHFARCKLIRPFNLRANDNGREPFPSSRYITHRFIITNYFLYVAWAISKHGIKGLYINQTHNSKTKIMPPSPSLK